MQSFSDTGIPVIVPATEYKPVANATDSVKNPRKLARKKFFALSIHQLHAAIKKSNSTIELAKAFTMSAQDFQACLQKLVFDKKLMNYTFLKTLSHGAALAFWGRAYDKPLTDYISLKNVPINVVHDAVILSHDINEAANHLCVDVFALIRHFANWSPMTFEGLKAMTRSEAEEFWQEAYLEPAKIDKIPLADRSMQTIHDHIKKYPGILAAASHLGASVEGLVKHLAKCSYKKKPLNYNILSNIPVDHIKHIKSPVIQVFMAKAIEHIDLSEENEVTSFSKQSLSNYSLKQVHNVIHLSTDLDAAADKLSISTNTFKNYLRNFFHHESKVDYNFLKNMTPEDAHAYWGILYTNTVKANNATFDQAKLSRIHNVTRKSNRVSEAAQRFGITRYTFLSRIEKLTYNDLKVNFDLLKELTVEEAEGYWQEDYDKAISRLCGILSSSPELNEEPSDVFATPVTFNLEKPDELADLMFDSPLPLALPGTPLGRTLSSQSDPMNFSMTPPEEMTHSNGLTITTDLETENSFTRKLFSPSNFLQRSDSANYTNASAPELTKPSTPSFTLFGHSYQGSTPPSPFHSALNLDISREKEDEPMFLPSPSNG